MSNYLRHKPLKYTHLTIVPTQIPRQELIIVINIAEYLNTNYNMNSIIKTAAKITEELSQPNEKSDAKQGIQNTKTRLSP